MSVEISIPDWVSALSLVRHDDGQWSCTFTGDEYRTGNTYTATRNDDHPQFAVNLAANAAGGAQERAVAMGLETADAIDEVAG